MMALNRLTPPPLPIEGDPCADPRVDCAAYRAAVAAARAKARAVGALVGAVAAAPVSASQPLPEATPGQTARNAAGAVGRIIGAATTGERLRVDEATRARRLALCAVCQYWDAAAFGGRGRCRACGCCTSVKASLATERCPKGQW